MMSFSPFTINTDEILVYAIFAGKYEVVLDGP